MERKYRGATQEPQFCSYGFRPQERGAAVYLEQRNVILPSMQKGGAHHVH